MSAACERASNCREHTPGRCAPRRRRPPATCRSWRLAPDSYKHSDKKRGTIFNPVLEGIDWVLAADVLKLANEPAPQLPFEDHREPEDQEEALAHIAARKGRRFRRLPLILPIHRGDAVNAPDTDQAIEFLGTLFEGCPEGTVWLTSLVLPGRDGEVRSFASRDGDAIADFAARHNHPDRAMYFCPSALQPHAGGRSKETVGWITGLHADIDFKNHDAAPEEILRRLDQAALPASLIVASGGGLHCYWLLREAVAATGETVDARGGASAPAR